jgi:predicted RNA-binding Zn-ribbon protein involved in translation (DUF1610 family)
MSQQDIRISNLWRMLEFTCGQPGENGTCGAHLTPQLIAEKHVVYKCPVCGASHNYYDIEKFINKIVKILVEDQEDGCETNLTNFKHKLVSRYDSRTHVFTVLSHTNTKMKVSLKNG